MDSIRKSFPARLAERRPSHLRVLLHLFLLLLYAWTSTETLPLSVHVAGDRCTARWGERHSQIPCPELAPGAAGLYLREALPRPFAQAPFDWLALPAAWQEATVWEGPSPAGVVHIRLDDEKLATGQVGEENRFAATATTISWHSPVSGTYTIQASLRRPDRAEAGILVLQPGGNDGWLFLVDSAERQGVWWHWQDGRPVEPLRGIPYQKPLLAQAQSLLRQILVGYLGALLLWLLLRFVSNSASVLAISPARTLPAVLSSPVRRLRVNTSRLAGIPARWALIPLLWFTFGSTLWMADTILGRLPHVQDSITYLFQAQTLARGHLWAPPPPHPELFEQEFMTVFQGKWFGQYLPGFPLLLSLGVILDAAWVVNPLLATFTIPLLYTLGRHLYDHRTGLFAAFLALFSPFFILLSGSMMVHPAELFWTTLFLVGSLRALNRPFLRRWAVLAGIALGMLLLTRQITAVAVALPFFLLLLAGDRSRWVPSVRLTLARQIGLLIASALPFLLLLLVYQYALTGSPWQDPRLLSRPFDRPGFGPKVGEQHNAFTLALLPETEEVAVTWYSDRAQPPRGHTIARGLYNTQQNWQALASHLLGWPALFTFAFCWYLFLWQRPSLADWLLLGIFLGVVGIYIFYWADGIMYGPRYFYAALPALLLLTGRGIQLAGRKTGRAGRVALLLLLLLLLARTWTIYLPARLDDYRGYNFIDGQARSQIEATLTDPSLVFVPATELNWWEYGRFFSGNTPWLDGPIVYARGGSASQNSRLRAHFPGRHAYRWLPGERRLQPLPP